MSGSLNNSGSGGGGGSGNLTTDAQHGNRGGGALHSPVIAGGANGFMTGADKSKLNGIEAGAQATTWSRVQAALGGQAGATAGLVFKSDGAGGGSMVLDRQVIHNRIVVGVSGDVDYTSIKSAVDYVITQSPSASNQFLIEVYPGTYTEAPMTLPSGIYVCSATAQIQTPVIVIASNPAADLFTLTGGALSGIQMNGVTDVIRCLVRVSDPTKIGVLINCTMNGCSNGLICDSGATAFIQGLSCTIKAPGQAITVAAITANNGSVLMTNGAFNAPQALDAFYSINMIEKCVYLTNGGSMEAVSCAFRVYGHNSNQSIFFVEGGGLASIMASHFANSQTALDIGSFGSNSVISCQAVSFKNNTLNFKIESSTGSIFANASVTTIRSSIVTGGNLSGIIQERANSSVSLIGDIYAKYSSGREANLLTFLEDQISTGVTGGGEVTAGSGLNISVNAGTGWIHRSSPDNDVRYVTWSTTTILTIANSTNYIYYDDSADMLVSGLSSPGSSDILLATVISGTSSIRFVHKTIEQTADTDALLYSYLLSNRKIILDTGLAVSQNSSTKFDVGSGSYYRALYKNTFAGAVAANFSYFYGTNGANEVSGQTDLNVVSYDSSGVLTTMTASYYKTDTVFLTSDGRISVVYGKAQHALLQDAVNEGFPNAPSFIEESAIVLASFVVQKTTGIVQIIDRRPLGALTTGSGGGVSDHGLLSGLLDDDHPQYILANGTRAMAGNLQMGGNAITGVGQVDGVTVSAHASRHLPGGIDSLTTATPVAILINASASEGSAASFARSDHQHGVSVAAPVTIGTINSAGTASTAVRSDHVHAHGAQTDGTLHAVATGSVAGFMSTTDKSKLDALAVVSSGSATLNFGAAPGTNVVSTTITGQTNILSGSVIRAFFMGDTTVDHNAFEHQFADIRVTCGNIVAGTGFDIVAITQLRLTGTFTVRWTWV